MFDAGDDPEIADSIPPQITQLRTRQRFANATRIV